MSTKEFKLEVLKELQAHRDLIAEWQNEAPESESGLSQSAWEVVIVQVLENLDDTIEGVEAMEDQDLQDEEELAHNELDKHDVPRLSDAKTTVPLWFRVRRLAEGADATGSEAHPPARAHSEETQQTWTLGELADTLAKVQAQLDRLVEESGDDNDGTS